MIDSQPYASNDKGRHMQLRLKYLKDLRQPLEQVWDLIDQFILPYALDVKQKSPKFQLSNKIYDGTTINASRLFASAFVGTVTPRGIPYIDVVTDNDAYTQGSKDLERYCKSLEAHFYDRFNESNFYERETIFVKKAGDYGTGAMYRHVNPETGNHVYEVLATKTYFIDEDAYGEVDTVYRELYIQNRHLPHRFPDANFNERILNRIKNNAGDYTKVIHAVEPRADYDPSSPLAMKKRFSSCYALEEDNWFIADESGFDSFPYLIWRPEVAPGMVWGVGPGIYALRDSQILQQAGRTLMDAANKAVDPPWTVPIEIQGEEQLFPGGRNYISGQSSAMQPLISGINYPIGQDQADRLRQAVEKHYFVDYFLMLNQMDARQRTATEVMELQSEKSAVISSISSSYTSGVLDILLENIFYEDIQNGIVPRPIMPGSRGRPIKFTFNYVGPLAQAQKRYHKISGPQKAMQDILPIAQFKPEVLDLLDVDSYAKLIADANNSVSLILDDKIVAQIRQSRAQQQQAMMQAQQQAQATTVAGQYASQASKSPEPGSPMERLMKQQQMQQ